MSSTSRHLVFAFTAFGPGSSSFNINVVVLSPDCFLFTQELQVAVSSS
jgi:hypothetical protein